MNQPPLQNPNQIIAVLIEIARRALFATYTGKTVNDDPSNVAIPKDDIADLIEAIHALDAIPQRPGESATGPARAERALETFLVGLPKKGRAPFRAFTEEEKEIMCREAGMPYTPPPAPTTMHKSIQQQDEESLMREIAQKGEISRGVTHEALGHDCYTNNDADRPDSICDRNGEVVLGLCKICNRAEAELSEPCEKPIMIYPATFTPTLQLILGHMCFQLARYADTYRKQGFEISTRAEDEQAFMIDRMLRMYLKHGNNWVIELNKDMKLPTAATTPPTKD